MSSFLNALWTMGINVNTFVTKAMNAPPIVHCWSC